MVPMRRSFFILIVFLWALPLSAQDKAERVVVMPIVYVGVEEPGLALGAANALVGGIQAELRSRPEQFELVDGESLRKIVKTRPAFDESIRLAASWAELGVTKYKELDSEGAVKSLEQALAIYQSVRWDLVEPIQMAEVMMYLALAHLDLRQDLARPLEIMADMIHLDPTRVLKTGFYPEDVVKFYDSARDTLERELRAGNDLEGARQLVALADVQHVIVATILPAAGGFTVLVHWFDADDGVFLPVESLEVLSLVDSGIEEAGSRLASRFAACLLEPTPVTDAVTSSTGQSPWAVELNFAYTSFLEFPESQMELFGNYGATFGASFSLTREFEVLAAAQILTSIRDNDGFLNDDFTTLRGFGGVGLGYSFGPWRADVGMLLEASTMGDIKVCDDINQIIPGCNDDPADYTVYSFDLLVGLNVRPRIKLQIVKSIEVQLGMSGSFYFFPLSGRDLNLPLTVESGVQYRF